VWGVMCPLGQACMRVDELCYCRVQLWVEEVLGKAQCVPGLVGCEVWHHMRPLGIWTAMRSLQLDLSLGDGMVCRAPTPSK
jgi:hypothetical protein